MRAWRRLSAVGMRVESGRVSRCRGMDAPLEGVRSRRSARCTCNNNFFQHHFFSSKFSVVGGSGTSLPSAHHARVTSLTDTMGEKKEKKDKKEKKEKKAEGIGVQMGDTPNTTTDQRV